MMRSVEGGQLTPEQQDSFDSLVGKIAELRNNDPSSLSDLMATDYFGVVGLRNCANQAGSALMIS